MSEVQQSAAPAEQPPQQQAAMVPGEEPWKKIWSLTEMRDSSKTWNLASDAGTKELENHVDGLVHDVKSTHVRVHNTFDQFLMLSHSQFIENRVYEDESDKVVVEETAPVDDVKPEITEEILIPKFTRAVALGLAALDKANAMSSAMETSEASPASNTADASSIDALLQETAEPTGEETAAKKAEKLDHYLRYPLPHIIGSQQFKEDDYCGLFIEESDTEEESENESEESSDEEDEKEGSPEGVPDYSNEQDRLPLTLDAPQAFLAESESSSAPLFAEDDAPAQPKERAEASLFDDDIFSSDQPAAAKPKSSFTSSLSDILGDDDDLFGEKKAAAPAEKKADPFRDELANALGGGAKKTDDDSNNNNSSGGDSGDLFGDVVEQKPKAKKSISSLFDDDDLFDDPPAKAAPKTTSTTSKKSVSFDDDSLFGNAPAAAPAATKKDDAKPKKALSDLFSNEFMDEEPVAPKASSAKKSVSSFLDDDDDDLFSSKPKAKPAAKKADSFASEDLPSVSPLGGDDDAPVVAAEPAKKKPVGGVKLFDFGGDDNDMFAAKKPSAAKTEAKPAAAPTNDEDSLFGGMSSATTKKKESTSDILGIEGDLLDRPAKVVKKHVPKSFDDSSDLLGIGSAKVEDKKVEDKKPASKKSFFEDIDESPLAAPKKEETPVAVAVAEPVVAEAPKKVESKGPKGFFDDVDIVESKPTPKVEEAPKKVVEQQKPTKSNFFDDVDSTPSVSSASDSDSLFGGMSSKKPAAATAQPAAKKDFFSDLEESKPATKSNDAPSSNPLGGDSLFGGISVATSAKAVEKKTTVGESVSSDPFGVASAAPVAKPAKKDFFSDADDLKPSKQSDSLFGGSDTKPAVSTKSGKDFFSDFEEKPKANSSDIFDVPAAAPVVEKKQPVVEKKEAAPAAESVAKKTSFFDDGPLSLNIPKPATKTDSPLDVANKSGGLFGGDDSGPLMSKPREGRSKTVGSMFEAQQLAAKEKEEAAAPAKKAPSGKISSLLGVLALDPSKMAPGAQYRKKKVETDDDDSASSSHEKSDTDGENTFSPSATTTRTRSNSESRPRATSVSEDSAPAASALTHATKSRPKSAGRRPPTRKGGAAAAPARKQSMSSDRSDSESEKKVSKEASIFDSIPTTTTNTTTPSITSSNDSLLGLPTKKSTPSTTSPSTTSPDLTNETKPNNTKSAKSIEDDMFATTTTTTTTKSTPTKSSASKSSKDTTVKSPSTPDSIFDDLPAAPVVTKPKATATKKSATSAKKETAADSLFDDVVPPKGSAKKEAAKKSTTADLFDEPAEPAKPKPAATKTKASAKSKKTTTLLKIKDFQDMLVGSLTSITSPASVSHLLRVAKTCGITTLTSLSFRLYLEDSDPFNRIKDLAQTNPNLASLTFKTLDNSDGEPEAIFDEIMDTLVNAKSFPSLTHLEINCEYLSYYLVKNGSRMFGEYAANLRTLSLKGRSDDDESPSLYDAFIKYLEASPNLKSLTFTGMPGPPASREKLLQYLFGDQCVLDYLSIDVNINEYIPQPSRRIPHLQVTSFFSGSAMSMKELPSARQQYDLLQEAGSSVTITWPSNLDDIWVESMSESLKSFINAFDDLVLNFGYVLEDVPY
eukprot:gene12310-14441_t